MRTIRALAAIAAVSLLLTACGSATHKATSSPAALSPRFSATYNQSAAVLLSKVPGCADIQDQPLKGGTATPGLVAIATCTLDGKQVLLSTWSDTTGATLAKDMLGEASQFYYAVGTGWVGSTSSTASDLPGQKVVADALAAALGGSTEHVGG